MPFLHLLFFGSTDYIVPMKIVNIDSDIILITVRAASFPQGIQEAFNELKRRLPAGDERMPYGISKPEKDGTIVYRAGVETSDSAEASVRNLEKVVLKKGKYVSETVTEWQNKIHTLSDLFEGMLRHPDLDPFTPCIEIYRNRTELNCMVRLKE